MAINDLARLCTKSNYIRSNYFSDTYRAEVTLNGNKCIRDIVHISIPFDKTKEDLLKSRCGFTDEQLNKYYKTFAENLKTSWMIEDAIMEKEKEDKDNPSRLRKAHLFREDIRIALKEKEKGSDIFLVYPVSDTLDKSMGITDEGANKRDILSLGIRLLQIAHSENKDMMCSFYFGLETLLANNTGLKYSVKSSTFMYSGCEKYASIPTEDLRKRTHFYAFKAAEARQEYKITSAMLDSDDESITQSMRKSLYLKLCAQKEEMNQYSAKIYPGAPERSIAILLWQMLCGRHYLSDIELEANPESRQEPEKPRYASFNFYRALREMLLSDRPDPDKFIVAIKDEMDFTDDVYISFQAPESGLPSYAPPSHIGDELTRTQEDEFDAIDDEEEAFLKAEYEKESENSQPISGRKKILIASITAVCAIALISCSLYLTLPMLGINLFSHKEETVIRYSADDNMYNLDGMVVDINANPVELYTVDDNGNICFGDKIKYEASYVSVYPVIDHLDVEIISKEFDVYPSLDDYPYRDGLCVIEGGSAFEYNPVLKTLSLPEEFVSENGITNCSAVLIIQDGEEILLRLNSDASQDDETKGNLMFSVSEESYTLDQIRQGTKDALNRAKKYDTLAKDYIDRYLKGKWTFILTITPGPESAVNKDIILVNPKNGAYEIKVNGEADYSNSDTITLTEDELKNALITITSTKEGPCEIEVKSAIGSYSELLPISFPYAERDVEIETVGDAFINEAPMPTPVPTPSPTPMPVQTPTVNYVQPQIQTVEVTPTPYIEPKVFSVSTSAVSLSIGQTTEVTTTGDDGGYIQIYSTDPSVAVIDIKNGIDGSYTITAVSQGKCTLMLVSNRGTVSIEVTVI